jgi:predicted metalloprotease with PDZ domain
MMAGVTALLFAMALTHPATGQAGPPAGLPDVTDVAYEITFDRALANLRSVRVATTFRVSSAGVVALSLPAWTPGAYEVSNFARNVSDFRAESGGRPIVWDKQDHDTWRVRAPAAGEVRIEFSFLADSLDNAMAWTRPDFLLVNGTNIFLFPEDLGTGFAATVRVRTEPDWKVATGMRAGAMAGEWAESNYHDLVDMPWFIGRFDLDSTRIDGRLNRLATYPAGALSGSERSEFWTQLEKMTPVQAAVFAQTPWQTYTTMMIFDSEFPGGSALEHQNSHVGIYNAGMIGNLVLPLITAHEQFHAWNVKRLRPADMVPYRYDHAQPTPWLWVSEGITDYYADLTLVRSGVAPEAIFYGITNSKIQTVEQTTAIALEDASVSAWIHPRDGTEGIYYGKGSLAGLLLDILIRDASDNVSSLDHVLRSLYASTFEQGRGFTETDWWSAVSGAANGRDFSAFRDDYIDGREPFPWQRIAPLAGILFVADTIREARIGVQLGQDAEGVHVTAVMAGEMAEAAGLRPGDRLTSIGEIPVADLSFGNAYRARYENAPEGMVIPIRVVRDGRPVELEGRLRFAIRTEGHIEPDPAATGKARRIRDGILTGRTSG